MNDGGDGDSIWRRKAVSFENDRVEVSWRRVGGAAALAFLVFILTWPFVGRLDATLGLLVVVGGLVVTMVGIAIWKGIRGTR